MTGRPHEGKLAIITGASRGIGAAIAENLAVKGANLILNYTSSSSSQKTSDLCSSLSKTHNIKAIPAQVDVGAPDAGSKLIDIVKASFGDKCVIHFIINNAGISANQSIAETTVENFQKQYAINVQGPLLLMQAALAHLPHDRSARIVNVSSVSSQLGYPGQSIYGGTKAALESMTRSWARELGERGTVNAINPGPVETDMYGGVSPEFERINAGFLVNAPGSQVSVERDGEEAVKRFEGKGGRPASVKEIAGVVGMLCAEESGWCTGSVVCAIGGMRMSI